MYVGKRDECSLLLLSSSRAVRAMECADPSLQGFFFLFKFISLKNFGELIVFRHLNMDFTIFLRVVLSDVSKLPLSFKKKHYCEVKKNMSRRH